MPQYDDKTGKLINWVENPAESEVPKELFRRLRKGQSMRSIARDLAAAGHVNRSGRPFSDEHLRTMALRPAYGGYRKHTPKSRGRSFNAQNVETNLYRAIWAPLVDEETFWAVRRTMLDPARRSTRNGRAKHVLTMTMKCDVCGGPVAASGEGASAYYFCRKRRCVQVNKDAVDALIIGDAGRPGVILDHLASDKVFKNFTASSEDSGKVEKLRAEIERLRGERDEAENAEPESITEARMFARMVETLEKKISTLEDEERRLTLPAVLTDLIKPGKDVVTRWDAAPVEARREVARLLLSADWLGEVRIRRGRGVPAAARVHWHKEPVCKGCTAA
jgi:hypothetical protein